MTAEPSTRPQDSAPIIVSATVSLAPEEIPSTNGPAIGLAKKVCSRKPEKNLYQSTMELDELIRDFHTVIADGDPSTLKYLHKLS